MGTFKMRMEIASTPEGPFRGMYALVDTGTFYSWVPGRILRELNIKPMDSMDFQLANGDIIQRERFEVVVRLNDQTIHTICVAAEAKDHTLLGAYTLEGLAVAVDPVKKRLIPLSPLPAMTIRVQVSEPRPH